MNITVRDVKIDLIPGPRYRASHPPYNINRLWYHVDVINADTGAHVKTFGKLEFNQASEVAAAINATSKDV